MIVALTLIGSFVGIIIEADIYLGNRLEDYRENGVSKDGNLLYGRSGLPYIAVANCISSRWYIYTYGTIPRWSPWSKKLDALAAELHSQIKKTPGLEDL